MLKIIGMIMIVVFLSACSTSSKTDSSLDKISCENESLKTPRHRSTHSDRFK